MTETVCAIATAPGGAIGVIRVSGPKAIICTDAIFCASGKKKLVEVQANTLTFGVIQDENKNTIDEVLVSVFRAPHSYTGENSTEISCHGSRYILQQVMLLLMKQGIRQALPGEFTQRAFLNGKMDLSQAEAVADLISSTNAATHKMAMSQLRGGFSKQLRLLREQLLHITSLLELELDFSEEDVEFADRNQLRQLSEHIQNTISLLTHSFQTGNALKNGVPVAIIGKTNVGKSTLLNQLLQEEKAIVSDIHGTTRDVIEDTINIQGITFRFIDTAGIRDTKDTIENLGIERTWKKIEEARIILWVTDAQQAVSELEEMHKQLHFRCQNSTLLVVRNKCDMLPFYPQQEERTAYSSIYISAQQGIGIDKLQEQLVSAAALPEVSANDVIVTNLRHYEALTQAQSSIQRVIDGLSVNIPGDLISQDLRECLFHLAEIVGGEITCDEVLGNVFKNFCIGK